MSLTLQSINSNQMSDEIITQFGYSHLILQICYIKFIWMKQMEMLFANMQFVIIMDC